MSKAKGIAWLGWSSFTWYVVFLLGPLMLVTATSLATRGTYGGIEWVSTIENFSRAFDPLYLTVLNRSIVLAFFTTLACALIGIPLAIAMATSSSRMRSVLVLLLAIPFLTNLVIRICALKSFTSYDGPLAWLLSSLGVPFDPYGLSQNATLVSFGMISTYLPFMVFPIYGALEKFEFSLVEAAQDLGASFTQVLFRILIPMLRAPVVAGALLVFVPAMGEFLIPDLLGGAKTMLAGNLISEQFLKARDWPFGSSLSVLLMAFLGLVIVLVRRLEKKA